MPKISKERLTAIIFFLLLIVGAVFSLVRLREDIVLGKYFQHPEELSYEIGFLSSYVLIILLVLRYGYYLGVNRVSWKILKGDFLYLLNKKYFSKFQWVLNVLLFWMALIGFIYSLAISTMKGNL